MPCNKPRPLLHHEEKAQGLFRDVEGDEMAIRYEFLERGPEALIETSELPAEGIAVAVRTTGYEIGTDEIVELSIVDLAGDELFSKRVKPQNIEEWESGDASGGISPADVEDAPELYQFEEEISDLFENAKIVVGEHIDFITDMIEGSWVTLAPFEKCDLDELFRTSHCTAEYPGQPAAVASLEEVAEYYGLPHQASSTTETASTVAACYHALVAEHAREREAKTPSYWTAYEREQEEAKRSDRQEQARERLKKLKALRVNAILWLCAAAIFSNLAVQLHLRAADTGFVICAAAAAVFAAVRWVMALYRIFKLRH